MRPGVYSDRGHWAALAPWERYRLRVHAVAQTWSDPVFCLESAASLLGLPVFGEPRTVHVLSQTGATWRVGDVSAHGFCDDRDVSVVDGIRTTSFQDTAIDLCRSLPPVYALAVADATLRELARTGRTLAVADTGRAQANRRGVRRLDWVQTQASARAESPGESVSRAVIGWLGYEEPELQVEFTSEGFVDRVDFFWRGARVVGESDGYGKYAAEDPETVRAHFVREKIREDRLRRQVCGFARWDWADVFDVRRLDEKLRRAGLEPVRRADAAMLRTLSSNPRSFTTGSSAPC